MNIPFRDILWPRSSRRATLRTWLPWMLALSAVAAGMAALVLGEVLDLVELWPLNLFVFIPWLWRQYFCGPRGVRAVVGFASRLLLFGTAILCLCEPRAVRSDDRLTVMFAVDHSSSITRQASDEIMSWVVAAAATKPERDEVGLLFFGQDAFVELPPAATLPFEAVNVDVGRDGTDVSSALSLGAAMLPEGNAGRIVLVSDGVDTEGDLSSVLDDLKARGVPVDVVPVQYTFESEVWIERLELPTFAEIGRPYEATVIVSSLKKGDGSLRLTQNGKVVFEDQVQLDAGKNRFAIGVQVDTAGYFRFEVEIATDEALDSWKRNNRAMASVHVRGRGSILIVTGSATDERAVSAIRRSLEATERQVVVEPSFAVPRTAQAILPYDCVVLVDVPRAELDEVQIDALYEAVFEDACGFLMVGGPNSYGPGGYGGSKIEQLLPVSMDLTEKKVMPKGALAIVLHTCEFNQGNTWGKNITKRAIKVLDPRDEVGVLAYDYQGADTWVFDMAPVAEYDRMARLINGAQIGDMPGFQLTMQMGLKGLLASDASVRHMIIISDGDPSPPTPKLLQRFVDNRVSVSTVAVFPHGGQDVGVMQQLSKATGGSYYKPNNPNKLPAIFVKEATRLRRSSILLRAFTPVSVEPSPILKGVDSLPQLDGYVLTTARPEATLVLAHEYENEGSVEIDPILSTWRYGVGASAAFTSDLAPKWCGEWVEWSGYRAIVSQMVTEISRQQSSSNLRAKAYAAGSEGVIVVEDWSSESRLLDLLVEVDGPEQDDAVVMRQVGARRYVGRFPLTGRGEYELRVVGGDGERERAHAGFAVMYSSEFMRFRSDPIELERIAERTEGRRLTGSEKGVELFTPDRSLVRTSRSIVDWVLTLLVLWLLLDVAFRRVQIDFRALFGGMRFSDQKTVTVGALLDAQRDRKTVTEVVPAPLSQPSSSPTAEPETAAEPVVGAATLNSLLAERRKKHGSSDS